MRTKINWLKDFIETVVTFDVACMAGIVGAAAVILFTYS